MAVSIRTSIGSSGLPTPSNTPHQTPSGWSSRQSHFDQSSPLPFISNRNSLDDDGSKEPDDENISPYDPRRFTPNLHASLVAEILSLRREVESKSDLVGNLEDSLHAKETENDQLNQSLNDQSKEAKNVKRQMQMLESGTLSALDDMAKEREAAVQSLEDARRRLESSKEKIRSQEEDAKRMNSLWDLDRRTWENEKRNMETKLHVAEGRVKTMVNEVASIHSSDPRHPQFAVEEDRGMRDTWYTKASDEMSVRTNSVKGRSRFSNGSITGREASEAHSRYSNLDGLHRLGSLKLSGTSLADELNFEAEEGEGHQEIMSSDPLPEELHYTTGRASQQSFTSDHKAFKVLGLLPEGAEAPQKERGSLEEVNEEISDETTRAESLEEQLERADYTTPPSYQDSATQCSPPHSPTTPLPPVPNARQLVAGATTDSADEQLDLAENERRAPVMVSAASQTIDDRMRTPTPVVTILPPDDIFPSMGMRSVSTQTSEDMESSSKGAVARKRDESISVPVIAIHPPGSRPNSSHNGVVLPPRTKNASCQANTSIPYDSKSVSVQTEAIKIDKRPVKLPPRLPLTPRLTSESGFQRPLISAASLSAESIKYQRPARRPLSKSLQRRSSIDRGELRMRSSLDSNHSSIANDNGFLNKKQSSELRRPVRSASLFAGFADVDGSNMPDNEENEVSSDDDFLNAAPIRKTLSKAQGSWKLVPQVKNPPKSKMLGKGKARANVESRAKTLSAVFETTPDRARNIGEKAAMDHVSKSMGGQLPSKLTSDRRPPVSSVGSAAGLQRARSPSAPDVIKAEASTTAPPFPVPTRFSSRKIPISASEGAQSPSPYTTSFFANSAKATRPPSKSKNPLRKVRSAATVEKRPLAPTRKPPPPPSPSAGALDSPTVPQTLSSTVSQTSSLPVPTQQPTHPFPVASLSADVCVSAPGQQVSVVDAIAQTMVGEWMWKYVRKRKSFGKTENTGAELDESGNSGVRHKRWVWLAPYERAIMWSSKQPTSGPALLGKSGRKLPIQSALDVKDDTPMPKSSDPQSKFGQSMLILTPQRALKFTAMSKERHHTWLTALTFLSHSTSGMDDLTNLPPIPRQELQEPSSRSSSGALRRSTLRDSIRIAKSKSPRPSFSQTISSPAGELPRGSIVSTNGTVGDIQDHKDEEEEEEDAAEAPHIPRTSSHNRKRSSTGPSVTSRGGPLSSSTSFPAGAAMESTRSLKTPVIPKDNHALGSHSSGGGGVLRSGGHHANPSMMRRVSENDAPALPPSIPKMTRRPHYYQASHQYPHHQHRPGGYDGLRNNFFDAVGTVRMEAFVDDSTMGYASERPNRRKGEVHGAERKLPTQAQGKKDMRYWGLGGNEAGGGKVREARRAGPVKEKWKMDDPFKGF